MKEVVVGTIRVKKGLCAYKKTKTSWKKIKFDLTNLKKVVKLFKAHKAFDVLVDKKDSRFLKGQLSPEGSEQGARINVLPDGRRLNKAFSLFSKNLVVHDQSSDEHWDVIYQNKGGTFSYVYTLDKILKSKQAKYKKVNAFEKIYPKLKNNVLLGLKKKEFLALPLYTLLETHMRVGNEIYYKAHGHKGLSTLKRKDVKIAGNKVTFSYIGKDGVPQNIVKEFPSVYINRLKEQLKGLKKDSFVFCEGIHPLKEQKFKQAFKMYCGKEFYPHIVRSYYATSRVEEFLKENRKPSKEETKAFLLSVADGLGHKKLSKKTGDWEDSYTVTLNHYIEPALSEKIRGFIK